MRKGMFRRLAGLVCALGFSGLAEAVAAQDLVPSPPLAANVDALPRLNSDLAVARKINATLQMLDDLDFQSVTCEGENPENASRSVRILSDGPEFLSILLSAGGACAGANYPFSVTQILNFDLETGRQTDLMPFLPEGWAGRINADDPDDDPLLSLYLDMAGEAVIDQCRDTLSDGHVNFELGPDDQGGGLMMLPDGLRQVELECENAVLIPLDRLKVAGFHPRLIKALSPPL